MSEGPSSSYEELKSIMKKSKNIVVLSGAGISAESGIPTFRGSQGLWRKFQVTDLATPAAFHRSPSLVWEFHHYGRELVFSKYPNQAHVAIAEAERRLKVLGRTMTVITQNVDGLHQRAGSEDVIELHGSLYKTLCLKCNIVAYNDKSPICPSLAGRGSPDGGTDITPINAEDLPRCDRRGCNGLLRPYTIWFGESLDPVVLKRTVEVMGKCDMCLVIGTSSVVYPAAMFAPELSAKGIPVAEFNLEPTAATHAFRFHFRGPCTETVTEALRGI